jgi:hypothetical protein
MPVAASKKRVGRPPKAPVPPPGSALAVRSKSRVNRYRNLASPTEADLRRWFQVEGLQKTEAQIAAEEGVNPLTVKASIDRIKEWTFRNQLSVLNVKAVQVLMDQLDGVSTVFKDGMKAEKVIFVDKETGTVKTHPDTAMRLKTVEQVRGMMETVQPKTPALQLNQQFNAGVMGGSGLGPGMSFEAILRKKREQAGLTNGQDIEEDEVITTEDEIYNEFKEFGGEEDDDEGEVGNANTP